MTHDAISLVFCVIVLLIEKRILPVLFLFLSFDKEEKKMDCAVGRGVKWVRVIQMMIFFSFFSENRCVLNKRRGQSRDCISSKATPKKCDRCADKNVSGPLR